MICSEVMEYLMTSSSEDEEDNDSEEIFDVSDSSSEDDEQEFDALVCSMKYVMKDYNFTSDDFVIYDAINLTYTVKNVVETETAANPENVTEEEKPKMKIICLHKIFRKYKICKKKYLETSNSLFDKMTLLSSLVSEELASAEPTEILHGNNQCKLKFSPNVNRSKKRELRFKRLRACVKLIRKDYSNVAQNQRGAFGETFAQKVMLRNHKKIEKKIMICLTNPDIDLPNKALITKELGIKRIVDKALRLEMASDERSQLEATNETISTDASDNDSKLSSETSCNAVQPSTSGSIILPDLSSDNSTDYKTVIIPSTNSVSQDELLSPGIEDGIVSEAETDGYVSSTYTPYVYNQNFEDISDDSNNSTPVPFIASSVEIFSSPGPVVVTNSLILETQFNSQPSNSGILKYPVWYLDNSTDLKTVTISTTNIVAEPEPISSAIDENAPILVKTEAHASPNGNAFSQFMYHGIIQPEIETTCVYSNKSIQIQDVNDKISQYSVSETTKKHLQDNETDISTKENIERNSVVTNQATSVDNIYDFITSYETVSTTPNKKFLNCARVLPRTKKEIGKKAQKKKSSTESSTMEILVPPDNNSGNETIKSTTEEQMLISLESEEQLPSEPSNAVLEETIISQKESKSTTSNRKTESDMYAEIIQQAKDEVIKFAEDLANLSDDNSCTLRTTRSCSSWTSTGSRYNLRSRSVCSYVISDDDFSDQDCEFTPKSCRSVSNLNVKPKRTYKKRNKSNKPHLPSKQNHVSFYISSSNDSIDTLSSNLTGEDTDIMPDASRLSGKDKETNGSVLNISTKTKKGNNRKKKLKKKAKPSKKGKKFISSSGHINVKKVPLTPPDMFLDLNTNDILFKSLDGTDNLTENTSNKHSASVDGCLSDSDTSFAESIPCPSDILSQSLDFTFEETDAQVDDRANEVSTESGLCFPNLSTNKTNGNDKKKKPRKRLRILSNSDDSFSESDNSQSKNISSCSQMYNNESLFNASLDFNFGGDTDSELNDIIPQSISEIYSRKMPISNPISSPSLREIESNTTVSNKEPENIIQAHENVNMKDKSQTTTKTKETKLYKRRSQIPSVTHNKGEKRKLLGKDSNKTLCATKRKSVSVQSENIDLNRNNILSLSLDSEPEKYDHPCFDAENKTIYTSTPKRNSEKVVGREGKNEKPRHEIKKRRLYNQSVPPKRRRNKTILTNITDKSNITEDNLNVLPPPEDSNVQCTNFEIAEQEISNLKNLNVTNLNEPAIKFPVMKPQVKNAKENITKSSVNVTGTNLLVRDKRKKSAVNVSNPPNPPLSRAERLSHPEKKVVRYSEHDTSPIISGSNATNYEVHRDKSRLLYPDNYMEKFRENQSNKADVLSMYDIGHTLQKKQIGSTSSENRKATEGNVTDKVVKVTEMVQEKIAGCDVLKKFDTDNLAAANFDGLASVNSEIRETEAGEEAISSRLPNLNDIHVDEPSLGETEQFEEVNRASAVSEYVAPLSLSPEVLPLQNENKVLDMCHRNGYIIMLRKEQVSFFKWRTGSMLQKGSYMFKGSIVREIQPRNHFLEQRTNHTSYNPRTRVVSFFQIFINQADSKATVFIYTCGPRLLPSKPSKFLIKLDSCLLLSVVYTVVPTDFQFTVGYTLLEGKQPFELKIFMHDPKSILPKVIRLPNIERACSHLDVVNLSLNEEEKRYMIAGYAAGRLTIWNFEKQQIYLRMAEPILLNEIPTAIPDILTKGQCAWMSICLDDEGIEEPIAYIVLWDQIKRHLYLVSMKFNHEFKVIKKQDVQRQYQNLTSITFGNAILCAIFKEGTLIFNWSQENETPTLLQKLPGEIFGRGHTVIFNNLSTRSMNDIEMEHFLLYNNSKLRSANNRAILNDGN